MSIKRGEIYWALLEPGRGSEQGGRRPVLVIQNNIGNEVAPSIIAAAITTKSYLKEFPTNVNVPAGFAGLKEDSTVLLSQIRTLDKDRLGKKVGELPPNFMRQVDLAIRISLGMI